MKKLDYLENRVRTVVRSIFSPTVSQPWINSYDFRVLTAHSVALIPGAIWLGFFMFRSATMDPPTTFTLFDDAMISMSYGKTLATTGELVYFPGADRIQGFTNPLWTLWMAFIHSVGLKGSSAAFAISLSSVMLIFASSILAGILTFWSLGLSRHKLLLSTVATATVPFLYSVAFWSLRGMEVGLLATLLLFLVASTFVNAVTIGKGFLTLGRLGGFFAAMLGVLTRIDFIIPVFAVTFTFMWAAARSKTLPYLLLSNIGGGLVGLVSILSFQKLYYSSWLPNTYFLKVDGFSLAERLPSGLVSAGKLIPVLAIIGILAFLKRGSGSPVRENLIATSLLMALFATAGYSIWVGGDAWENSGMLNRYISVALPGAVAVAMSFAGAGLARHEGPMKWLPISSLALVISSGASAGITVGPIAFDFFRAIVMGGGMFVATAIVAIFIVNKRSRGLRSQKSSVLTATMVSLVLLVSTSLLSYGHWLLKGGLAIKQDVTITRESLEIKAVTLPDAKIAVTWAGATAYYTERRIVDILGKNDAVIAKRPPVLTVGEAEPVFWPGHNKWDYGHSIFSLKPDMIFQTWAREESLVESLKNSGYISCDLPETGYTVLVRLSSRNILWDSLHNCRELVADDL